MESKLPAYKQRGIPRIITIQGRELFYKDPPLKNDIYVYRCRKGTCKYFIKINKSNIDKFINNEKDIEFTETNKHTCPDEPNESGNLLDNKGKKDIRTEKETKELAIKLINSNITENLDFHFNNFKNNKIFWVKSKIRKLVYNLRELKFPKEEEFLNAINLIKIKLNENKDYEEMFCPCKGEFINYKKKED